MSARAIDAGYDATLDAVRVAIADNPRSQILQTFAAGLQREAPGYAAGREDGEKGASFRPLHFDLFSYASGYVDGQRFGRKINGG